MDPISFAMAFGAALVGGATIIAGIASLFRGDAGERQIKRRAKDARRQMDRTSREYLRDVDHLLRR